VSSYILERGSCILIENNLIAAATFIYNIAECVVGALPVTFVSPEKDKITPEFLESKVGRGSLLVERQLYEGKNPAYDAEKMKDLPVGVQVVGGPFEEERVLMAMKIIDEGLKERQGEGERFGPGEWTKKFIDEKI
jgi:hypothetical protein